MRIEITAGPDKGRVIEAEAAFADIQYPGAWVESPAPVSADTPENWRITPGSFKDRFDTLGYPGLKLTILGLARTSDTCYGVLADLNGRTFVDLLGRKDELALALSLIASELSARGKPTLTADMQTAILTTPPRPDELAA